MRKQICLATLVLVCVMVAACGGKYDAVENTLNDYADVMETYVASMDQADDSDAVVKAMNDFTDQMQELAPRLQEINHKFPELASANPYPEALEAVGQRITELSQKVQTAMLKTVVYMMDPQVQQAMTDQAHAMAQTGR